MAAMESREVPPKCARCLAPLTGDNIIISPEGEAFHQRCWVEPKRSLRPEPDPDHLCPICLQTIEPSDKVTGQGDDVIHMHCDYLRPSPRPGV
jgi:hypothetical protein